MQNPELRLGVPPPLPEPSRIASPYNLTPVFVPSALQPPPIKTYIPGIHVYQLPPVQRGENSFNLENRAQNLQSSIPTNADNELTTSAFQMSRTAREQDMRQPLNNDQALRNEQFQQQFMYTNPVELRNRVQTRDTNMNSHSTFPDLPSEQKFQTFSDPIMANQGNSNSSGQQQPQCMNCLLLSESIREYQDKCEQYQAQLSRLREFSREQDNVIASKMSLIETMTRDVMIFQEERDRAFIELNHYKDTLKKMYMLYTDQDQFITDLKLNNTDLVVGIDRSSIKSIQLMDEVKHLLNDKEMFKFRMMENQKKTQFDQETLHKAIEARDEDMHDLRRRYNDLLEVKRRTEEGKETTDFELEHLRTRVAQEVQEREVRQAQHERAMQKEKEERNKIVSELTQKITNLQIEHSRLIDDNKHQVREMQNVIKDLRFKEFDYSRLKEESMNMSKALDFNSTTTAEAIKRAIKDYALRNDKENVLKRLIPGMVDKCMDLNQKNSDRRSKILAMNLWKCKFLLRAKERQIKEMTKTDDEAESISSNFKNHTLFLAEIAVKAMEFIRLQVAQLMYQIFDTTLATCNKHKINALVLFLNEVKKLRAWTALKISLDSYHLIKSNLVVFLQKIRNLQRLSTLERKLEINTGEMSNFKVDIRDNMNLMIQKLIKEANESRERDKFDENSNICYLYKLMAIKKRSKMPLDNKIMKFDEDLLIILDDKIITSLRQEVN